MKPRVAFVNLLVFVFISLAFFMGRQEIGRLRTQKRNQDDEEPVRGWLDNFFRSKSDSSDRTENLLHREKLWMDVLNKTRSKSRKKRYPDVIVAGAEGCGAEALGKLLTVHPLIKPTQDTKFFSTNYAHGEEYYRNKMPWSTEDEVVMEVSPTYFTWPPIALPKRVKNLLPLSKMIFVLCSPVDRAFNDFNQEINSGRILRTMKYEVLLGTHLRTFSHEKWSKLSQWDGKVQTYMFDVFTKDYTSHILSSGIYYAHVARWMEEFGPGEMMIISRDDLLTKTAKVMKQLQEFIGLPELILSRDFVYNNAFSSHCFQPAWSSETLPPETQCPLRYEARRKWSQSPTCEDSLRGFYAPFNKKLYKQTRRDFGWG